MKTFIHTLKNNRFYLLCFGQMISQFGNWFYVTASYFIVYKYTGHAFSLSILLITIYVPKTLSYLMSGKISDRINVKYVMVLSDVFRAAALVPLFFVNSRELIIVIYVVNVLLSVFASFFQTSKSKCVKILFQSNQNLIPKALSILHSIANIIVIIGSVMGGLSLQLLNFRAIITINIITFIISILFIVPLCIKSTKTNKCKSTHIQSVSTGSRRNVYNSFLVISEIRRLMEIYVSVFFVYFAFAPINLIPPIIAIKQIGDGAMLTGVYLSSVGIGFLLGSIAVGSELFERKNFHCLALACSLFMLPPFILFYFAESSILFTIISFILAAIPFQIICILSMKWILNLSTTNVCGRNVAFLNTVSTVAYSLSYIINGYLVDHTGSIVVALALSISIISLYMVYTIFRQSIRLLTYSEICNAINITGVSHDDK